MGAAVAGILDFGAFPGKSDASVTIAAPGIATNSHVEAYVEPAVSDDHSADEHMVETMRVFADKSTIVADTSCDVKGFNVSQIGELPLGYQDWGNKAGAAGKGTRLYGKWNVVLVWK